LPTVQDEAKRVLVSPERQLGFSFIRFLPKNGGVRPIVNLKRKPTNYAAISVLDNEGPLFLAHPPRPFVFFSPRLLAAHRDQSTPGKPRAVVQR
jgi:hypothetical protein